MESLNAQNTSQWVGFSSNSDPLIRRQEALMEALCQYISSDSVKVSGQSYFPVDNKGGWEKSVSEAEDSCRFHILSDVTDEEVETITISVGSGTLINYKYNSLFEETDDKTRIETVLTVTYGEDSKRNKTRSQHEYRWLGITHKSGSDQKETIEFTYKCENIRIHE